MKCLKCKSENCVKNGLNVGVQRYKCKECGYNFTKGRRAKPTYLKRLALQLYLEGLGFRAIGRILKVGNVSILNWIRKYGEQIDEIKSDQEIFVAEVDEMYSYVGSKKNHAGYGLLLIDMEKNLSILSSKIDLKIQEKPYLKP